MKIAFYAPLKPPGHPVPSGDRLMARQFISALGLAGHDVTLASELRARLPEPQDFAAAADIAARAEAEVARLTDAWKHQGSPDLWFAYHPYYKSPDLIGPPLCARFGLPYVTAESSYSARRNESIWAETQRQVVAGLGRAAVNLCLTRRDRDGIHFALPGARTAMIEPFVEPGRFPAPDRAGRTGPVRLVSVAMMRAGEKADSYSLLADALARLPADLDWRLEVLGDGPAADTVRRAFAPVAERVGWAGLADPAAVARALADADLYAWPGFGEAYGLAYLEAQAAGLPVVAQATAGVPEVVRDGETGLLVPEREPELYARALARLIRDAALRQSLGRAAHERVLARHSIGAAAARLRQILSGALGWAD
ncbi:MAG: glycosyltransferase family 4 protein [Paracoccaceae bacterium]